MYTRVLTTSNGYLRKISKGPMARGVGPLHYKDLIQTRISNSVSQPFDSCPNILQIHQRLHQPRIGRRRVGAFLAPFLFITMHG